MRHLLGILWDRFDQYFFFFLKREDIRITTQGKGFICSGKFELLKTDSHLYDLKKVSCKPIQHSLTVPYYLPWKIIFVSLLSHLIDRNIKFISGDIFPSGLVSCRPSTGLEYYVLFSPTNAIFCLKTRTMCSCCSIRLTGKRF